MLALKVGVGGVVGAVPREVQARIVTTLAGLLEVEQRRAGRIEDAVVTREPFESVEPRRVHRQRLQHIIIPVAVDFVVTDEQECLAMQAHDVAGRQDDQ